MRLRDKILRTFAGGHPQAFIILAVATVTRFSLALPVISEIGVVGADRGLVLSISGDGPFSAEFSGKDKSVIVVMKGCVYGLPEFSYNKFSTASPLRNIIATEKDNSTVELTINLKRNVKLPIKAVRKNGRWMALLSDEPVEPFTWSSPGSNSAVSYVDRAVVSSQRRPAIDKTSLENIRFLQRGQICQLSLVFNTEVICSLQRKGAIVNVEIKDAGNNTGKTQMDIPGSSVFKRVTISENLREGSAVLNLSIVIDTMQIDPDFNVAFTKGRVLSLYIVNRNNRKATLWTSDSGLSWDYQVYDVPSYNIDFQAMGNRAVNDVERKIDPKETFFIKGPSSQSRVAVVPPDEVGAVKAVKTTSVEADTVAREKDKQTQILMITTADNLNLRSSPSRSAKAIGRLDSGDTVRVLSREKYWSKVEAHGLSGYVYASYLREIPGAGEKKADIQTDIADNRMDKPSDRIIEPPSSITMISSIKSPQPTSGDLKPDVEPFGEGVNQSSPVEVQLKRVIRYNGGGRDPFKPIVPSSVSLNGLPFVENLTLVGVLYDDEDRIALCEDIKNDNQPFALREHDPVEKGNVLKIYRDKAVFLITEFGVSRSFTLELSQESSDKEARKK